MIIGIFTKFFRESNWFRIIRTTLLALVFGSFSEYVLLNLATCVILVVLFELADLFDEKAKESEENPSTQDDDESKEEESQDKSLPRRRSQRKRKATVTFADEQEEKDKIE